MSTSDHNSGEITSDSTARKRNKNDTETERKQRLFIVCRRFIRPEMYCISTNQLNFQWKHFYFISNYVT